MLKEEPVLVNTTEILQNIYPVRWKYDQACEGGCLAVLKNRFSSVGGYSLVSK